MSNLQTISSASQINKQYPLLDADSYTAHRLHHATPEHLHFTSRRTFIGPIPKGWSDRQRKRDTYGQRIIGYKTRTATFSAQNSPAISRRNTQIFDDNFQTPPSDSNPGDQRVSNDTNTLATSSSAPLIENAASQSELLHDSPKIHNSVNSPSAPNSLNLPASSQDDKSRKKKKIRFDLSDRNSKAALILRTQMTQSELGGKVKNIFKSAFTEGEIFKMDKMLVRVDKVDKKEIPLDYDENTSQAVDYKTIQKFREYVVVCRKSNKFQGSKFVLQMYKTRVIPALEQGRNTRPKYEIPIDTKLSRVNMYSSLDKSLVFWSPGENSTQIYILQSKAPTGSVEWLTFLKGLMGNSRTEELPVHIPDIRVTLKLQDPFASLKLSNQHQTEDGDGNDDPEDLLAESIAKEQNVATSVIEKSLEMLGNVAEQWSSKQPVGLAWKRYDRLEWVHGVNELKMFGTLAMLQSHDLELRLKQHYPMSTTTRKGKILQEPSPIEGFLIRLTSQTGHHQRLGLVYSTRLYFATFDQYLCFVKPNKAITPNLPKSKSKDVYKVNPYPLEDESIEWLNNIDPENIKENDQIAFDEAKRKLHILDNCEGFIDLAKVVKVRKLHMNTLPTEIRVEEEESNDDSVNDENDQEEESDVENGSLDQKNCFEVVLSNGLIIKFKAYDHNTKKEWKKRLTKLAKYWRWRHLQDIRLLIETRERNLKELQVDEEGEAWAGQFGRKWELQQTNASPELFNMCGISCCRSINHSGPLYFKSRHHGTFTLHHCMLIPGALLCFQEALRTAAGKIVPHIHHGRVQRVDLSDCYLYSGLLTEGDLLYRNLAFDPDSPGHHALPRIWVKDGWDNFDEDVMTCFVLWRPSGKSWFRTAAVKQSGINGEERKRARIMRVSALGKKGNRIVFRARSRAERDMWVIALTTEIERMNKGGDEFRITGGVDAK